MTTPHPTAARAAIHRFEIPAADLDRAQAFYKRLFAISLDAEQRAEGLRA